MAGTSIMVPPGSLELVSGSGTAFSPPARPQTNVGAFKCLFV